MAKSGNQAKKLAVLELIRDKKHILFSAVANKKQIEEGWDEVLIKAQSVSLAGESRKWNYAKTLFNDWKTSAMKKLENGGEEKLNEVDQLILDIVKTVDDAVLPMSTPATPENNVFKETPTPKRRRIVVSKAVEENITSSQKLADSTSHRKTITGAIKRSARSSLEQFNNKSIAVTSSYEMDIDQNDHISIPTGEVQNVNISLNISNVSNEEEPKNFDLFEIDVYLRRLQILKLEKELNLRHLSYTINTRNDEVELYHRRLQALKLERELGITPSKYTIGLF